MMFNINDIKNGMTIKHEGVIYQVVDFQHVKPGKGSAFVKTKLKNLRAGTTLEITFNAGIKMEKADVRKNQLSYLYAAGDNYVFMDMNTYDQFELSAEQIGDKKDYLLENMELDITKFGNEILGISLPEKIEFTVVKTEPAVKGGTTTNASKDAFVETGMLVKVPLFINEGEKIIVTSYDGKYYSRA